MELCLAVEELSVPVWVYRPPTPPMRSNIPAHPLCSDARRRSSCPISPQARTRSFGLTEANAGSDASGIQTTAKLDGNEYVLNGTKQWITTAVLRRLYDHSDHRQGKGASRASAFVVEKEHPASRSARKRTRWASGRP